MPQGSTYAEMSYSARLQGWLDQIRDVLARFEIRDEPASLYCTECGERCCSVDEFDTLDVLASVALDHVHAQQDAS